MSNYLVMYYNYRTGNLNMMYLSDLPCIDEAIRVTKDCCSDKCIIKETFLKYHQYLRDQLYIYEDMMNDFYDAYDLPSN